MSSTLTTILQVRDLVCQRGETAIRAAELSFASGNFSLLAGEADSGHDLLLRVLGLLEVPDAGQVFLEGEAVQDLGEDARMALRDRRLGFVFTAPFLLPAFSVIENVAMPLFKISSVDPSEARRRSEAVLGFVGLVEGAQIPATELTPPEQQRVSLARALVNEPAAVLVEGLDATLSGEALRGFAALLREAPARFGVAVLATASPRFVPEPADQVIAVADGAVQIAGGVLHHPGL